MTERAVQVGDQYELQGLGMYRIWVDGSQAVCWLPRSGHVKRISVKTLQKSHKLTSAPDIDCVCAGPSHPDRPCRVPGHGKRRA